MIGMRGEEDGSAGRDRGSRGLFLVPEFDYPLMMSGIQRAIESSRVVSILQHFLFLFSLFGVCGEGWWWYYVWVV